MSLSASVIVISAMASKFFRACRIMSVTVGYSFRASSSASARCPMAKKKCKGYPLQVSAAIARA